jgi:hypothetical protein
MNPPPEVVSVATAVPLVQRVANTTQGAAFVHPLLGKVPRMKVLTILPARRLYLPTETVAEVAVAVVVAAVVIEKALVEIKEASVAADDGNTTVIALQARLIRKKRSTNPGVVMKARRSSRLRPLLQMMPLLNRPLLPRVGIPVLAAMNGVLEVVEMHGVPNLAILTGPLFPLRPTRTQKRLPSGLIAVQGTVKRKSQIIR